MFYEFKIFLAISHNISELTMNFQKYIACAYLLKLSGAYSSPKSEIKRKKPVNLTGFFGRKLLQYIDNGVKKHITHIFFRQR